MKSDDLPTLPSVSQASGTAPTARWLLARGCAVTYFPREAGVLRVQSGRVWATLNPSPWSPRSRWNPQDDAGDFFVAPGQDLPLRAGQGVVIESWPAGSDASSSLVWEPLRASAKNARWQQAVAEPLRDIGRGLVMVGRAAARLTLGLAGYAEFLVAGRGKVQSCMESNAP